MTPLQIPWRTECIHTEHWEEKKESSTQIHITLDLNSVFCARRSASSSSSILVEMCGKKHFDFGKAWKAEKRWKNHASRITATVLAAAATQHTINQQQQRQQNDDNRQILNLHGNFIRAKRTENDFLNEATGNEEMKAWKVNENKHEHPKKPMNETGWRKAPLHSNGICCSLKWSLQFFLNAHKIMNRLRHYLFACLKSVSRCLYVQTHTHTIHVHECVPKEFVR